MSLLSPHNPISKPVVFIVNCKNKPEVVVLNCSIVVIVCVPSGVPLKTVNDVGDIIFTYVGFGVCNVVNVEPAAPVAPVNPVFPV